MPQEFEKGLDVADVYAAALFALATEAQRVDAVRSELEELVRLMEEDRHFAAFASSVAIDTADRARSLERIFRGRLSDLVLNTIQVMNQHGRLNLIHALHRGYVLRDEDARGQIEVAATSAVELSEAERREIAQLAEKVSGRKPLVTYVVDPEVIGGLILQIGDYRYDNSIRRHLHDARARLLERSERGLKVGARMENAE